MCQNEWFARKLRRERATGLAHLATVLSGAVLLACSSSPPPEGGPDLGNAGPIFGDDDPNAGTGGALGGENGLPGACVGETARAEAVPAALQLVVDTSGSMDQRAPGTRNSKWVVTRRALLDALDAMPGDTSVGVVFYPDMDTGNGRCFDEDTDVELAPLGAPASAHRRSVERAFRNQSPEGGTPTHDAYRYAFGELEERAFAGNPFLVLITDGTPTFSRGCEGTGLVSDPVEFSPIIAEARAASARGISTFVIGSPGSEGARADLSRMAEAGGTRQPDCSHQGPRYCHFDMTAERDFASALGSALAEISGLALACSYEIPPAPGGAQLDPERVNVRFDPEAGAPELLFENPSPDCDEGWRYSEDGTLIELCRNTCDRVRAAGGSVTLEFGCQTRVR